MVFKIPRDLSWINFTGRGGKHQQKTRKAVRRLKCKVPGCRAKAIQIRDLVKSRMPEIVEPKQLIQSRVLVKRARLTVKRGAARPNGKPKPPQSPLRRAVRYRIRGAARHSTQDYQRGGRGRGTENEGSANYGFVCPLPFQMCFSRSLFPFLIQ